MKTRILRRTLVLAVATIVLTVAGPLLAAPLYETGFDDGDPGDLPADWWASSTDFGLSGSSEYAYGGTGATGLSYYTGALTNGQPSSSFSNGTIVSNFRKGGTGTYTGVIGRRQSDGSYYAARLYAGQLQVWRFGTGQSQLGYMAAPGYDAGETWRIEMSLLESQIRSKVFDETGAEIASVTVNDSQFTGGTAGVRSNPPAVWEDFKILAPEGLNVDIGLTGQQVQAGFQSFVGPYTGSSPQSLDLASDLGLDNQVNVKLSSIDLRYRDRTDVTHALGDLAEDFVFTYGSTLDLTLDDLKPGRYQITTYHHDVSGVYGTMDLSVSDATRTSELVTSGLAITSGTNPTSIGQTTFSFISNGVDPVVVRMDKTSGNFPMIDGFEMAAEETLNVDFGLSSSNAQADFFNFLNTDAPTATIASGLGNTGTVDVTVGSVSGWRDRGDMPTIGLGALAEDFVYSSSRLELTLEDLAPGQYAITTYHHDLDYSWSSFDIDVDDAFGLRTVAANFSASRDQNDPALLTFTFQADGINPVIIGFDPYQANHIAMLNGFSLARAVPEPSSLSLLALGLLGLCMATGRRKRA